MSAGGAIEQEITALLDVGDTTGAASKAVGFLKAFSAPTRQIANGEPSGAVAESVERYAQFIQAIDLLLSERKTGLLPRQASIFTTNYDLFIEKASEKCPAIILNDGFHRAPTVSGPAEFRSEKLFDATLHTGNHYEYTAEIPSINLIKLHGSLSWHRGQSAVLNRLIDLDALDALSTDDILAMEAFLDGLAVVLPTKRKFRETIIDRTYYDLLRVFANVLERENTLLFSFGFSFRDEHIVDIVKRALRNPTLLLIVSCYTPTEAAFIVETFASYNNVTVLIPEVDGDLNFDAIIRIIEAVPQKKFEE